MSDIQILYMASSEEQSINDVVRKVKILRTYKRANGRDSFLVKLDPPLPSLPWSRDGDDDTPIELEYAILSYKMEGFALEKVKRGHPCPMWLSRRTRLPLGNDDEQSGHHGSHIVELYATRKEAEKEIGAWPTYPKKPLYDFQKKTTPREGGNENIAE